MQRLRVSRNLVASVSVLAVLLSVLFGTVAVRSTARAAQSLPPGIQASITPHTIRLNDAVKASSSALLPCLNSTTIPLCYSPQQIRRAYGIQPLLDTGITGKGSTIVIIDDYQSPTLNSDLALFDKIFDLPDPQLNIIAPNGLKPFDAADPNAVSFAGEISLDVEWAHAVAPDATIDLVLGNPADSSLKGQVQGIADALTYATSNDLGGVYSLSISVGETCFNAAQLQSFSESFATAQKNKATVYASAGDNGSATPVCDQTGTPTGIAQGAGYPSSDPLVSGVGGTSLVASKAGDYVSETTWNGSASNTGATGGGFSTLFTRPAYQDGVPGIAEHRGVPDVAYNADPMTGVPVVVSMGGSTMIVPFGGTSAGAPQWAGITALAEQAAGSRLGCLNGTFYNILKSQSYSKAFNDTTTGSNAFTYQDASGNNVTVPGYNAGTGWDPTTGVGTPKVSDLVPLLLASR